MSEATFRALINDVLVGVDKIGLVHDYERWNADFGDFIDLMRIRIGGKDVIRGWEIGYRGLTPTPIDSQLSFGNLDAIRQHRFVIRGYLGVYDADQSEKDASILAESVCNAMDSDTALNEAAFRVLPTSAVVGTGEYSGTLCHVITVTVRVEEYHE